MELVIQNLSKTYANGVHALAGLSLTIPNGMFGLLGPNGAGKSTLMRTIATLQRPDAGTIRLGTLDVLAQPDEVRKLLGYLPQEFGLYPNLSAEMVLDHFASLKGVSARGERKALVDALLQQTNLYEVRAKRVGGFSGGMKQRLGIAIALAGQPQLLIVDEPTAGLDPTERRRFLNLLADISEDVIVILSTHIVDDVRELCQRMAIINLGQVVFGRRPAGRDRCDAGPSLVAHGAARRSGGVSRQPRRHLDPSGQRPAGRARVQRDGSGQRVRSRRGRAGGRLLPSDRRPERGRIGETAVFWTILRMELAFLRRRASPYLYFAVLFFMAFGATVSDEIQKEAGIGTVFRNAPVTVAQTMLVLTVIGQVITTAIVGAAILRDVQIKAHELLFTTRVTRLGYLGGRFTGAVLAMIAIYAALPLGAMAGTFGPWVDHTTLEPFHLATYARPFFLVVVPDVLIVSALFFAVGALTRSLFAIYTQGIALVAGFAIARRILDALDQRTLSAMIDPFGVEAYELLTRYWTVSERNVQQIPLSGPLLANRLTLARHRGGGTSAHIRAGAAGGRTAVAHVARKAPLGGWRIFGIVLPAAGGGGHAGSGAAAPGCDAVLWARGPSAPTGGSDVVLLRHHRPRAGVRGDRDHRYRLHLTLRVVHGPPARHDVVAGHR